MDRFISILIRMFAQRAIFSSGRKLFKNLTNSKNQGDLARADTSQMTPKQKKAQRRKIQRQKQQMQNKTSPWIYILSLIIGVLVLYIMTQR